MNFAKYLRTPFLKNTCCGCFLNMFSFGLYSVISKAPVADFEHVFVCWEMYRINIDALRILEIPYPANKHSKATTEPLKQDVESVKN